MEFSFRDSSMKVGCVENITLDEVGSAFQTLTGSQKAEKISAEELHTKLKLFQPSCTLDEVKFLLGGEPFLTRDVLETMLVDNSLHSFDSAKEVLPSLAKGNKTHDGGGAGTFVDETNLKLQMEGLGIKPLSSLEWRTLLEEIDLDKDGIIGCEDLRESMARWKRDRGPRR